MYHKSAVVQEAEEIIENYIKKQEALSKRFRIKSKRKIHSGVFLLLGLGVTILLGMFFFLFL